MGISVTEIYYNKLDDFFNDIVGINGKLLKEFTKCAGNDIYNQYIFRGESSINNKLIPSALRIENENKICNYSGHISPNRGIKTGFDQINCEELILHKFYLSCDFNGLKIPLIKKLRYHNFSSDNYTDNNEWLPDDYFELASLAQHYGLPTRLLDWSFNFFIALYFALCNTNNKDEYCSVWAFNYLSLNRYFTSRPNKIKVIVPEYSQNPNLKAQKGVFTHWQIARFDKNLKVDPVNRSSLDELFEDQIRSNEKTDFSTLFYKINIPIKFSKDLYFYLSTIGIDGSSLFPGYGGITRTIVEDALFLNKFQY